KGPIVSSQDYYPFGLTFNGYSRENGTPNKYKFGGKEEQTDLALNTIDWGWRQYDPAIGRWNVVDQWAEKYNTSSSYAFVQNNPITLREIDGRYFEGKDAKSAARIERTAEKRANKLEAKAARIEARGGDSGDRRGRASELRQSGQDVKDMRSDQTTQYRYAKVDGKESKQLGIAGPTTTLTGQNERGHNVVTMFTESNTGTKLHESRHGGQNARGEYNVASGAGYGVADEVSAYRAQYAYDGKLNYMSSIPPDPAVLMERILAGKNPLIESIININEITSGVVNSIVDQGTSAPLYPPAGVPKAQWDSN
ncbi:MAG: RHS repeat-associated core domain-containing protein, partial [Chryseolinea sp.]